jgi:hypothetical protein
MYDRTGMAMSEGSQLPDYQCDQGGNCFVKNYGM